MAPISWDRELLPEFLWLAALSEGFAIDRVHQPLYTVIDALAEFWEHPFPMLGLLSDFGLLRDKADQIWAKHESLLVGLFHDVIGRPLSLYPGNPASWLVRDDLIALDGPILPAVEVTKLRRLVVKLLPGRDGDVGHLRTLPVGLLIRSGRVHMPHNAMLDSLFPKYPHETSPEEAKLVQSNCRALLHAVLASDEGRHRAWAQQFWRANMDLVPCRPVQLPIRGGRPATEADIPQIASVLSSNSDAVIEYLRQIGTKHHYDLYDPDRDEILLGLLARCVRLYSLIAADTNLWARDTSGIMLRCLTDTAITFSYLAQTGTTDDFRRFREYGEGQEKLLMLHLQDSHPEALTVEGRTPADISEELGGFYPELIEIELGHWSKKDTRQLAIAAGMEEFYRVVYSPTSSDLHGTWLSLKYSSLWRCGEPLHRFHRIPALSEPLAYLSTVNAATKVLEHVLQVGHRSLRLPEPPALGLIRPQESDEGTTEAGA